MTHRGTRAIQKMVEYAPSTGGLALWMRHVDVNELDGGSRDVPALAANDGKTIYYAPAFDALALRRQIGVVAHQVLHVALRHAQRGRALAHLIGAIDRRLFNTCADAIVNSTLGHLGWLDLGPNPVLLEALLGNVLNEPRSPDAALLEWDLERLYRAIDDRHAAVGDDTGRARERDREREQGRTGKGERLPDHRPERPDADAGQPLPRVDGPRAARVRSMAAEQPLDLLPAADDERPEHEAEQAREWRERIIRAHAGDGLHSMLRQLVADLPKVRTPWEQVLRTLLARGLTRQPGPSWSRPARSYIANQGRTHTGRRLPWEPGTSMARPVARLAVMVDVSGSIDDGLLGRFAAEIEAISRRLEAPLTLIIGDDAVRAVAQFEPGRSGLRDIAFDGGGGTDFAPLLREADRHAPDIGVVLTDLDGPADFRPAWPVIWAVTAADEHREPPFGRKLVLD